MSNIIIDSNPYTSPSNEFLNPFAPLNHGKLGLGLIMDKEKTLDQKH
jgi:hypothetical protein